LAVGAANGAVNDYQAQAAYDAAPQNADSMIWIGRRLAYRGASHYSAAGSHRRPAVNYQRGIVSPIANPAHR